jgi:tetratricopeptide (TPR) repeat protein
MKESAYLKSDLDLMKQKRFEEAIEALTQAAAINPNNPFIFSSNGR